MELVLVVVVSRVQVYCPTGVARCPCVTSTPPSVQFVWKKMERVHIHSHVGTCSTDNVSAHGTRVIVDVPCVVITTNLD